MAGVKEEEVEYESDPDEAKLSLAMRRREASDDEGDEDEDEDEGDGDEREERREKVVPRRIDSDGESDGQGAPAEYDDDDDEEELEEEEEYEDEVYEEIGGVEDSAGEVEAVPAVVAAAPAVVADAGVANELDEEGGRYTEELEEVQVEEEKKENEPFAVPTAGAFYMHDDRFRDNAGGRHRRTLGGRKLWESKDDNKWGHDKFEEMSLHERHNEEGRRNSRGRFRGRGGKKKTADQGYQSGNRTTAYNNNNQNLAPKAVRGRGPRRYEASSRNSSEAPSTHNKQYGKSGERTSHPSSGRSSASSSNIEPDPIPPRKHMVASSLNIASPPFYPSGSSNKEVTSTQKRDLEIGSFNRNLQPAVLDENFPMPQSNAMIRGKNLGDSIHRMNKVFNDDSISAVAEKPSTNYQLPSSGSSLANSGPASQSRAQGRGHTPSRQMNFQPTAPHNQGSRGSPPTHMSPGQTRVPFVQAPAQQSGKRPGGGSQSSSPPKSSSPNNSFQHTELESSLEFSKSKGALVGKVRDNVQGSGRGSFLYNGAQIVGTSGNMGSGNGDQNFPTPAFLPVMPFGGQHPRGMGVPAVGMAFPGYVAQPQLGLGNSEMTWLPVLTGAAGALGASYCPPYIAVDGAYHARPSGQASALGASGKETMSKPAGEWTPQRSELTSDEAGQRQNNARRYSKMSFGQ